MERALLQAEAATTSQVSQHKRIGEVSRVKKGRNHIRAKKGIILHAKKQKHEREKEGGK